MDLRYEHLITGRRVSLFAADIESRRKELLAAVKGARIAVIGAAGSIGSSVVRCLLEFSPAALTLIDLSENNLVELVRELQSTEGLRLPEDFRTLPIGMGSVEFRRFFRESRAYDYVLNLAAMKHVRSEKDVYSLTRMLDTNVLFLDEFITEAPNRFRKLFSVSSDKAANPASLMGASKMIMEQVLLYHAEAQPFSTARFANVAFSDGSLPYGFLQRIAKNQPLAAPSDVRRYFISHQEAGELCVLSCMTGENRDVYFPRMAAGDDELTFAEIAERLLAELGYAVELCASAEEARMRAGELIGHKKWPCCFFPSDTDGEKPFEEFHTEAERVDTEAFQHIGVIKRDGGEYDQERLLAFLDFARKAKSMPVDKEDYVKAIADVVPGLGHVSTGRNLDQKM